MTVREIAKTTVNRGFLRIYSKETETRSDRPDPSMTVMVVAPGPVGGLAGAIPPLFFIACFAVPSPP